MKVGVVVFPGSNCDRDAYRFMSDLGFSTQWLWHGDTNLKNVDLVFLPGGFSYGDYLRSGAIAKFSPIMEEIKEHADQGGTVVGICNGFQILIESGLLPGVLLRNKKLRFLSKNVFLKVINTKNRFCTNFKKKNVIELPIAHNEGNYFANNELLNKLEDENLIAFKYCDVKGNINQDSNPNGSSNNIAGLLNDKKNVLGMMPHPERMVDNLISNSDGVELFTSILN